MIRLSINSKVINKTNDHKLYNTKFQNMDLTTKEILDHVLQGHSLCVAALTENEDGFCHRSSNNYVSGQIVGIDIDNTDDKKNKLSNEDGYWSYEDAVNDKTLKSTAAFIYTTPSHEDGHNRFRIIFTLKNGITDKDKFHSLIKYLTAKYSGDIATTSIVQGFYGSNNAEHEFWGNILDDNDLSNYLNEAQVLNSKDYQSLQKSKYDLGLFSEDYIDEILQHIFINGSVDNSIWWKVPTILKAYCKLPDSKIVDMIGKYVQDTGDISDKLKFADKYIGEMTIGTLIYYGKLNGYELPVELIGENKIVKFWTTEIVQQKNGNEKMNIHLSYNLFNKLLYNNGFSIIEQERGNQIVRIDEKNQIVELTETKLRDFVFEYLKLNAELYESKRERFAVEEIVRRSDKLIAMTLKNLTTLNSVLETKLISDTNDYVYIFYENGYRKIGRSSDEFLKYEDLKGYIWKKSVLDRKYKISDKQKSEHQKFVECVCTKKDADGLEFSEEKFDTLKSAIGYLLSKYKKRTETIAIVLTDEAISEASEGGTGKSIFNEAVGKIRSMTLIDGRNLNLDSPFHFSDVYISTEVINVDDCAKSFNFEKLYHSITGDITVERKGKNRFTIPFDIAPKFCFSTNHIFNGYGNSHDRRIFEVEFSGYFNSKHTPENEFGHQLFNEWDNDEWNRFDDFMAECVQYYMKNGLVRYEQQNIVHKRFVENTSVELAEYLCAYIKQDKLYKRDDVLCEFNKIQKQTYTSTKFTQDVRYYAEKYLGIYYYDEFNRNLETKIFVVTSDAKKNMLYWKQNQQFEALKGGCSTAPTDIDTTEWNGLIGG